MKKKFHRQGDNIIVERRRLENLRQQQINDCKTDFNHKTRTDWENKSEIIRKQSQINLNYQKIKAKQLEDLQNRRDKLRKLLSDDAQQFADEMLSLQEPPEKRRENLKQRALKLKSDREEKEKQFCIDAKRRLFREANDNFRQQQTKLYSQQIQKELHQQIEEKKIRDKLEKQEEKKLSDYLISAPTMKTQYSSNVSRKTTGEIRKELENQIEENKTLQMLKQLEKEERDQQDRDNFQKIKEEQYKQKEKVISDRKKLDLEIVEINQQQQLDSKTKQLEEDRKLLEQIKLNEIQEKNQETQNKLALRTEQQTYLEYLKELAHEKAQIEKNIDKLRTEQAETSWFVTHSNDESEQLARRRLLENVFKTQQEQIAQKAEEKLALKQLALEEREKLSKELEQMKEEEKKRKESERKKKLYQANMLQAQINQRVKQVEDDIYNKYSEKQQNELEDKLIKQQLIEELTDSSKYPFHFGKKGLLA